MGDGSLRAKQYYEAHKDQINPAQHNQILNAVNNNEMKYNSNSLANDYIATSKNENEALEKAYKLDNIDLSDATAARIRQKYSEDRRLDTQRENDLIDGFYDVVLQKQQSGQSLSYNDIPNDITSKNKLSLMKFIESQGNPTTEDDVWLAGQLGPQAATPEEVVTVPAASIGGAVWGARIASSLSVAELEAGLARNELKKINLEIRLEGGEELSIAELNGLSVAVGAVNAGLELVGLKQLLKTVPGGDKILKQLERKQLKELVKDKALRSKLAEIYKEYGKAILTESTTEMLQETSNIVAEHYARKIGGIEDDTLSENLKKNLPRIIETGTVTAGSMMWLGGFGSVSKTTHILVKNGMSQKQAQQTAQNMTMQERQYLISENMDTLIDSAKTVGFNKIDPKRYDKLSEGMKQAGIDEQQINDNLTIANKIDEVLISKYDAEGEATKLINNRNLKLNFENALEKVENDVKEKQNEQAENNLKTIKDEARKTEENINSQIAETIRNHFEKIEKINQEIQEIQEILKDITDSVIFIPEYKKTSKKRGKIRRNNLKQKRKYEESLEKYNSAISKFSEMVGAEKEYKSYPAAMKEFINKKKTEIKKENENFYAFKKQKQEELNNVYNVYRKNKKELKEYEKYENEKYNQSAVNLKNKYLKTENVYDNFVQIQKENDLIEQSPEYWQGSTIDEAKKYLNFGDKKFVEINSPVGNIKIYEQHLKHLIDENNSYRKKYLNRAIETIKKPNLVVKNGVYNNFIKLFYDDKNNIKPHLQIVKIKDDGNFYVTTLKPSKSQIKKTIIEGQVIYDLSSLSDTISADNSIISNSDTDFKSDVKTLFQNGGYDWNENIREVKITAIDGDLLELNNSIKIPKTIIAMEGVGYNNQKIGASFWLDFGKRNLKKFSVKDLADLPREKKQIVEKTEHNSKIEKIAEKHFGTTTNLKEAGYILTNGKLLDLSGKKFGGIAGRRSIDHREINDAFLDISEYEDIGFDEFIDNGAIRYMPESSTVLIARMPSEKQFDMLKKIINQNNGEISIEMVTEMAEWGNSNNSFQKDYEQWSNPDKILEDVRTYFNGGNISKHKKYFQNNDSNIADTNHRASIEFKDDETIISLAKSSDASSVMHEFAHLYLHDLKELAKVNKRAEADFNEVCKTFNFDPNADYGLDEFLEFHENFARSFEAYLLNGEAPTSKMKPIFERFKDFLREVYHHLTDLNVEFSPEVKECFDRLLTTDEEYEKEVKPLYVKNDELVKAINEQNTFKQRFKNNTSSVKKAWDNFYDTTIIPIETRLYEINPELKKILRKHTFDLTMEQKKDSDKIKPFLLKVMDLKKNNVIIELDGQNLNAYNWLSFALNNADGYMVNKIIKKLNMEKEFKAVRDLLDDLYGDMKEVGMEVGYIESYFPRKVKADKTDAFVEMFEKKAFDEETDITQGFLDEKDAEYSNVLRQIKEKDEYGLWSNEDKAKLINTSIRGFGKNNILLSRVGNTKFARSIDKLTPEQQQFYEPIENALSSYVLGARKNIEEVRQQLQQLNNKRV